MSGLIWDIQIGDISPSFKGSTPAEKKICRRLIALDASPRSIQYFIKHQGDVGNYFYWFLLGTLWVNYSGFTPLETWRILMTSGRPGRQDIMKPSELAALEQLGPVITCYRAHRVGENHWISYTLSPEVAARFAREREQTTFTEYTVDRRNVMALFLRRGEQELIVLDESKTTAGPQWTVKSL